MHIRWPLGQDWWEDSPATPVVQSGETCSFSPASSQWLSLYPGACAHSCDLSPSPRSQTSFAPCLRFLRAKRVPWAFSSYQVWGSGVQTALGQHEGSRCQWCWWCMPMSTLWGWLKWVWILSRPMRALSPTPEHTAGGAGGRWELSLVLFCWAGVREPICDPLHPCYTVQSQMHIILSNCQK